MSYNEQVQGSLCSWKTSWLLLCNEGIILTTSQLVFAFILLPYVPISILQCLTRSWIETTIYRTWCEYSNYCTTGALLLVIAKISVLFLWNIYIHFIYAKQKMHYLQINNMVIDIYIETCSCHRNYVLLLMCKEGPHFVITCTQCISTFDV